jgi:hypothetical protein
MPELEFYEHKKHATYGYCGHTNSLSLFKSNLFKNDDHRIQSLVEAETAEPIYQLC